MRGRVSEVWSAFRDFVQRGNVLDMAVGIAVGTAFTAVVRSLVDDIIMPPIAMLVGMVDFTNLFVVLREGAEPGPYLTVAAANEAGAVTWRYGLFVNALVSFFVVAVAVFLLIRVMRRLLPKPEALPEAPATRPCPMCCEPIALAARRCPHCTSAVEPAR